MTILSKALIGSAAFVYLGYTINNIIAQYNDYVNEEGFTLTDFGWEDPSGKSVARAAAQRKKKPAGRNDQEQRYITEMNQLSYSAKVAEEQGNFELALSCMQKILEITEEYPPLNVYTKTIITNMFQIANQTNNDELKIKIIYKLLDTIKPTDDLEELLRLVEFLTQKLIEQQKYDELSKFYKKLIKKYPFSSAQLATIYHLNNIVLMTSKDDSKSEEFVASSKKAIQYAKESNVKTIYLNTSFDLLEHLAEKKNNEAIIEILDDMEAFCTDLRSLGSFLKIATTITFKNDQYPLYIKYSNMLSEYYAKNSTLEKPAIENILLGLKNQVATGHLMMGEIDKAMELYNEIKDSEYLVSPIKTETKYLETKTVSSKNGIQKITIIPRTKVEHPFDTKTAVLVCEFENAELLDTEDVVVVADENKDQQEESKPVVVEDENKQEESKPVEQEQQEEKQEEEKDTQVEESIEKETTTETQTETETKEEQEQEIKEQEEQEEEEKEEKEEKQEEPLRPTKPILLLVEKPWADKVKFENNSKLLNPKSAYLAKISLYSNNEKTELISTHIQIIPAEKPASF
ncbi:hypothetical protein CYY_006792 [Polysphondylium violaceum]|uniref:Uncharacterized protein n=1 Tax=Polysphondylium violaceum TaxID=133409 RepID=A0A8J4PPK8_9MYCE|nr:hypothetical protein CYY_006792 [Polysphondylium violaceum]